MDLLHKTWVPGLGTCTIHRNMYVCMYVCSYVRTYVCRVTCIFNSSLLYIRNYIFVHMCIYVYTLGLEFLVLCSVGYWHPPRPGVKGSHRKTDGPKPQSIEARDVHSHARFQVRKERERERESEREREREDSRERVREREREREREDRQTEILRIHGDPRTQKQIPTNGYRPQADSVAGTDAALQACHVFGSTH